LAASGLAVAATGAAANAAPAAETAVTGSLSISATADSSVGETVSVTLANRSTATVKGELEVDPQLLRAASGAAQGGARVPFSVEAGRDLVLVFRVLPPAAGSEVRVFVASAAGTGADGQEIGVPIEGNALMRIRPRGPAVP
jgi:hypothetical protein